jgi:hypothetical protein
MTDPDEIARCAAARRARREASHCGACGRPFVSQIGAPECDCPPIKLRAGAAWPNLPPFDGTSERVCEIASAVEAPPARAEDNDVPPPSGWRDRPSLL